MESLAWEDRDGARWIRFEGELDNPAVQDLRTSFEAAVDGAGSDVVVDLGNVTFLTSLAVGMLIDTKERLKAMGGRRLSLTRINPKVRNAFDMMALGDVFDEV